MSRSGIIVGLLVLCLTATGLVFHRQISQFLFEPGGLSIAAGELCVINKTSENLVIDISVEGGARTVTFMVPDEEACAASPEAGRSGKIRVSQQENQGPFCDLDTAVGETVTLTEFAPPDKCGWQS